jgi:hypothetical protein
MYTNFYHITLLATLIIASVLFFKKETPTYLKLFAPFLLIELIASAITTSLAKKGIHTLWIYNIVGLFEFCFYITILKSIITTQLIIKVCNITLVIFPILSFLNFFFLQGIKDFNSITYSVGCLLTIFLCIVYIYELFQMPTAITLITDTNFWIVTSLLFFYSVSFPLFACLNFMKDFPQDLGNIIQLVIDILNIILYILFCIAFVCKLKVKDVTQTKIGT